MKPILKLVKKKKFLFVMTGEYCLQDLGGISHRFFRFYHFCVTEELTC